MFTNNLLYIYCTIIYIYVYTICTLRKNAFTIAVLAPVNLLVYWTEERLVLLTYGIIFS